jgi:putative tricarboxylic transport membrane protein
MSMKSPDKAAASNRSLEFVTAGVLFGLGIVLIKDSIRVGNGWGFDGPQAGYFPFYIGVILCTASVINFIGALRDKKSATQVFLTRHQLGMVMSLLVPTTIFVIVIKWLGIYLSATLLIAWFMRRMGHFAYAKTALVSLGFSVVMFLLFEVWFKVPLPKGPIEAMLGFS